MSGFSVLLAFILNVCRGKTKVWSVLHCFLVKMSDGQACKTKAETGQG